MTETNNVGQTEYLLSKCGAHEIADFLLCFPLEKVRGLAETAKITEVTFIVTSGHLKSYRIIV